MYPASTLIVSRDGALDGDRQALEGVTGAMGDARGRTKKRAPLAGAGGDPPAPWEETRRALAGMHKRRDRTDGSTSADGRLWFHAFTRFDTGFDVCLGWFMHPMFCHGSMRRASLGILLSLITVTLVGVVGADDHTQEWDETPRTYTIEESHDSFTLTGIAEHEAGSDLLEVTFGTDSDELHLSYTHPEGDGNESVEFGIRWVALIEFMDHDQDGRYSLGDPIVQHIDLTTITRDRINTPFQDPGVVEIIYPLPSMFGSDLTVRLDIPQGGDAAPGPHAIPVTMVIDGFQYDSDNRTRLALETRFLGDADLGRNGSLAVEGSGFEAVWGWNRSAVDPVGTQPVGSTIQPYLSTPPETLVVFSYNRSETVSHASTMQVAPVPEADEAAIPLLPAVGDWRIFLLGIVLAVGVVAWSVRNVMQKEDD